MIIASANKKDYKEVLLGEERNNDITIQSTRSKPEDQKVGGKRNQKNATNKKVTNMIDNNPTLSIITLSLNGQSAPVTV